MNYCCRGIGHCCSSISSTCDRMCHSIQQCCGEIFKTPFDLIAIGTFLVCGYPLIFTLMYLGSNKLSECYLRYQSTLMIETLGNVIHIIFAIYLACRMRQAYEDIEDQFTGEKIREKNVLDRVKNLFLYDIGVFIYIFIYIFYVYWTIKCTSLIEFVEDSRISYNSRGTSYTCNKSKFEKALITNTSSNYAF